MSATWRGKHFAVNQINQHGPRRRSDAAFNTIRVDALWPHLTAVVVAASVDDDADDNGDDGVISVNVVKQQLHLPRSPPLPLKRLALIGAIYRKCHVVIARKSRKCRACQRPRCDRGLHY